MSTQMWPAKKGLGPQLTWGLHGANMYLEQRNDQKPWVFARSREEGININKIHNSTQRIVPPQLANLELSDSKSTLFRDVMQSIPDAVASDLQQQAKIATSQLIYDPKSVGKILDTGNLRRKRGHLGCDVVAYVSKSSQSQLVVQHIEVKNETIVKNPEEIEKDEMNSDRRGVIELKVPIFGSGVSIDFELSIKQIEIAKSISAFKIPQEIILVRTLISIFVVKVEISNHWSKKISLSVIHKIDSNELFENDFAHVMYDPHDNLKFAVADTMGNWAVLKSTKQRTILDILYCGSVNDFEDFSSFKRITWGNNDDEILLMSRTYLKKIQLSTGKTTDLIIAKQWSQIREYKMSDSNDCHGFLLTSRELIWVDTSNGFKRLLSWKHYLDPEDPSLTMQIHTFYGIHFIMLYTHSNPLLIIFQFRMDEGFARSIHDPMIIKTDNTSVAQNYILLPIQDKLFSLLKITTQLEIKKSILASFKGSVIKHSEIREKKQTSRKTYSEKYGYKLDLQKLGETALRKLNKSLFGVPKEDNSNVNDERVFQDYAIKFNLNKDEAHQPVSMFDFTDPIEKFDRFEEFDNMFYQLAEHFKANNLEFVTLGRLSKHVIDGGVTSFEQLYNNLFKSWRSSIMAKKAATDVGLSLSLAYDIIKESRELSHKIDGLPKSLRNIVDEWDKNYEEEEDQFEENERLSQVDKELFSQPTQPVIQITQLQPATLSISQRQQEQHFLRSSSQKRRSSQKETFSQGMKTSQSTQKKKKKRIKGFA